MGNFDLRSITASLLYLSKEGARIEQVLQDANQFGVAIARAEACTFWLRDGDYVLVRENTAYPVCRTRRVPGARLRITESDRPGLTAYMAYQFLERPSDQECFNLSGEAIRKHPAYREADKEPYFNPYFPISKTSLSILCAPVRVNGEYVGMIKAENRFANDGNPSDEKFTEEECSAMIEYATIVGDAVMPAIQNALFTEVFQR